MTTQTANPFVLPGFGQAGELGSNPLLASMEMMRQAWLGLAGSGASATQGLAAPLSIEELDKRIADLRTIENWLRMNMSMLASTIQGLEVQRATIATLKSFVSMPVSEEHPDGNASPLEVALGLKPSGQARIRPAAETQAAREAAPGLSSADPARAWWNLVQDQFNALATATSQGAQAFQAAQQAGAHPEPAAEGDQSAVKSSVESPAPAARKSAPRKSRTTSTKARSRS